MKGNSKLFNNHQIVGNNVSFSQSLSLNDKTIFLETSQIEKNALASNFPLNKEGYFGEKGKNTRVIYTNNPIEDSDTFFKKLSDGGKIEELSNHHGLIAKMDNDDIIVYRQTTSTPNSPAVSITIMKKGGKVKSQKIHFIKKDV